LSTSLKTISPVDGRVYVEREFADGPAVERALERAREARLEWRSLHLDERRALLREAVRVFVSHRDAIAEELTWQMGRPLRHAPQEVRGFEERANHMIAIAPEALAPIIPEPKAGFQRQIKREPVGTVVVVAPWNYPYLTAVNALWPALLCGNAVILKHSHQTPLCAERLAEALAAAGVPRNVYQYLHLSHDSTARLLADPRVHAVAFTGSVAGGHAVAQAMAGGFATAGLELGGKDPGYVRADADVTQAIETLTDGAFYNAGQSCCGIKRIYVHERLFERVVTGIVDLTYQYRLGDPTDAATTLGPVVRAQAAESIRAQIADARSRGARALIDPKRFTADRPGTPYLAPQVLIDVEHSMPIMREETFGPAVGIMKVTSDEEAVRLMNDSEYGLTAAIFSADSAEAGKIADQLETGTVFLNRCDYLDPALAWTGVKNSGRGCTLSRLGFEQLTRPKSYHFKVSP
jgi:acyl-CoA reductase-like NAD-dependent aldehyde dehydrogenase